jgi:hypothetical protein
MVRFPGFSALRRVLIGQPLPTSAHAEERFNNAEALAILSSDALSSVAYATQEIVLVLGMAGAAALSYTLPITGLIVGLMLIVATSYMQTIKAYPHGGGGLIGFPRKTWGPCPAWWPEPRSRSIICLRWR